jgi:cell division protease FtsH
MPADPPSNPPPSPTGKPRRRPAPGVGGNWMLMAIFLLILSLLFFQSMAPSGNITWGDFLILANDPGATKDIKKITLMGSETLQVELFEKEKQDNFPKDDGDKNYTALTELRKKLPKSNRFTVQRPHITFDEDLSKLLDKLAVREGKDLKPVIVEQQEDGYGWLRVLMTLLLPALIILGILFFLLPRFRDPLGGGFLSNYIKSPAKRYERNKTRVTFEDVAGMQNAKSELQEVVEFLKSPEKFQRLGAVVPKGVLLVGPPGTGKTLLARAVAGEAGVPFFSISGSEFIQMFVGVGASRVRDMFKTAKENAPCILFIDEIDAVGRMRGAGVGGGSDEREQTLNQILSEMDGFTPTETVIVMAATNRPDVLDSALLRPGRFDRHVTIDRPTWQGRLGILKVHTRNKPLSDEVNLEDVARATIGMTGADLRNLANEAALLATREGKSKIDRSDFDRAADRVLIGARREEMLSPEEKRRTAYHEAGHALCAWLTPQADPIFKLTIIPRGQALGMLWQRPDEDRMVHTQTQLTARLIVAMGGRAADRLIFNEVTSGANMDLKMATRWARLMVTQFGMSERVGPMTFRVGEEHVFLGKEIQEARDFSEGTATIIDEEVQKLLRAADEHAYDLIKRNRDKMESLVEALVQREELVREEIDQLLHASNGRVTADAPTSQLLTEKRE